MRKIDFLDKAPLHKDHVYIMNLNSIIKKYILIENLKRLGLPPKKPKKTLCRDCRAPASHTEDMWILRSKITGVIHMTLMCKACREIRGYRAVCRGDIYE
jgi:hypothetical protein